jgi:hypothetical protein
MKIMGGMTKNLSPSRGRIHLSIDGEYSFCDRKLKYAHEDFLDPGPIEKQDKTLFCKHCLKKYYKKYAKETKETNWFEKIDNRGYSEPAPFLFYP